MGETHQRCMYAPGNMIDGRYEVLNSIGSGGMGEVLRAADHVLEKEIVALKVVYPHVAKSAVQLARFRNEVVLARKLSHPNIVRLFDFGDAGQAHFFISMEYIDGEGVDARMRAAEGGRLPFPEVVSILFQLCMALHYAHKRGVVHRDLKPGNILICQDGSVKLTDFGVARSLYEDKHLTATNEMVGTPIYMSPEQFRGERPHPRMDIYALGILAYEMASGESPFKGDNAAQLQYMHLCNKLPNVCDKAPGIPGWFRDFVEECADKNPNNRFESMAEAGEPLFQHLESTGAVPCAIGEGFCPLLRKVCGQKKKGFLGLF